MQDQTTSSTSVGMSKLSVMTDCCTVNILNAHDLQKNVAIDGLVLSDMQLTVNMGGM